MATTPPVAADANLWGSVMNRLTKWVVGLGLAGIVAAAGLSALVARIDLADQLRSAAAEHGFQLSVDGDIGFTFWPAPSVTLDAINFADRIEPSLVKVEASIAQLRVAANWQQLLSGQLGVDEVVISGADIVVADFAALAGLASSPSGSGSDSAGSGSSAVAINQLTLVDSTITGPIGGLANSIALAGELLLVERSGQLQAEAVDQPVLNGKLTVQLDWATNPSAVLSLRAGRLNIGQLGGAQPLWIEQLSAQVAATSSALVLHNLTGLLAEGELVATGRVDIAADKLDLIAQSRLTAVNLTPLLASQQSELPLAGSVNFSGDWQASLPLNDSTAAPLLALQGRGRLDSAALRFTATNLERDFCSAATLIEGGSLTAQRQLTAGQADQTPFKQVTASWQLSAGQLLLTDLAGGLEALAVTGTGSVDLLAERYQLNMDATLSSTASRTAGCDLNPALLDRALPFSCRGSYGEPASSRCRLDPGAVERLLKGKLIDKLQRSLEEQGGKSLSPLLDKLFR